jgi:uncharacterized protein with HEPN domain
MSRDDAYLVDMLEAARTVQRFTEEVTWEAFSSDEVLQTAVLYLVQTIGEAAANITEETRLAYPAVPWRSMVGMRNLLVHRYWEIDLRRVWSVVTDHLPALIQALQPIVPPEDGT